MITYPVFKKIFDAYPGEPECEIYFNGSDITYMIIKYAKYVTFCRCSCGNIDGTDESKYDSLDTLFHSVAVDGVCLEKDWDNIETIVIDTSFDLAFLDEIENLKEWLKLDI